MIIDGLEFVSTRAGLLRILDYLTKAGRYLLYLPLLYPYLSINLIPLAISP